MVKHYLRVEYDDTWHYQGNKKSFFVFKKGKLHNNWDAFNMSGSNDRWRRHVDALNNLQKKVHCNLLEDNMVYNLFKVDTTTHFLHEMRVALT